MVNFYIVLGGLVKIFAGNLQGDEAIIEIVGFGNAISDIFGEIFLANAKAMEDTIILSISLEKFRGYVKKNNCLMINMMHDAYLHNRLLVKQIEQLKLGDAKQKIGQFLLKLAFKKTVNLKYSKSEIASYLGMRLETLSRALQKLKDDGEISVKKNKITFLKENSLCCYCDNEISEKCDRYNPLSPICR